MNLLNLAIKIGADTKDAEQGIESVSSFTFAKAQAMGQAMYDATKLVAGKAFDMVKGFTAGAIEGFGEYEQLASGMEKLFGTASETVIANSKRAYTEAGMSQNQYLEASSSLAASLIKSLGGDTEAAAERVNVAMKAIADNADTFGTSVEDVTAVYMSLSKGMYQTLDNLKLGYAGTKEGMEQLIADANKYAEKIGETGDMTIDSYADIVRAIDLVQQSQKFAGTSADEASTTIQGSLRMAKNAWEDFLTAVGSGDQQRIMETSGAIISAIFGTWDDELGRKTGGIIANVLPVVQNVGKAIIESIPSLASSLSYQFTEMIANALGMDTGYDEPIDKLLGRIFRVIKNKLPKWAKTAFGNTGKSVVENFFKGVDLSGFGKAFETAGKLAKNGWNWIQENIVPILPTVGKYLGEAVTFAGDIASAVMDIVEVLSPFIAPLLGALAALSILSTVSSVITTIAGVAGTIGTLLTTVGAALPMIQSFSGLIAVIGTLLGGWIPILVAVVGAIVAFIATNKDARAKVIEIWGKIKQGFSDALDAIKKWLSELPDKFNHWLYQTLVDVIAWGKNLGFRAKEAMQKFKDGITEKWEAVKTWFSGLPDRVKAAIQNAAEALKQKGREFLEGLKNGIIEKWENVKGWVSGIPDRARDAIAYAATALVNKGKELLQGLKDGIVDKWENVVEWFSGLPSKAFNAIGDIARSLYSKGWSLLNGFWNGLKDIWSNISTWLSGKLSWASTSTANAYADAKGGGGGASDGGGGGGGDDGGGAYAARRWPTPIRASKDTETPPVNVYITLQYNAGDDANKMVRDIADGLKLVLGGVR